MDSFKDSTGSRTAACSSMQALLHRIHKALKMSVNLAATFKGMEHSMNKLLINALLASLLSVAFLHGCAPADDINSAPSSSPSTSSSAAQEEARSSTSAVVSAESSAKDNVMQNRASTATISVKGVSLTIDLADTNTAAAFAEMLPLKVEMSELNGNEKYVYLDEPLPMNATNPGTIEAGDVMLYGDDCLVVFYKSHPTMYSYTRIGKIADASGLADAVGSGAINASFTVS